MGNLVSCQYSCDQQTVDHIFKFLRGKGYIRNLKKNLEALQEKIQELRAIQRDVKNKIGREESQGQKRLEIVQLWLTRVEKINTEVNNLLRTSPDHLKKLCLRGLCSTNVFLTYNYGKSVFSLLEKVKILISDGKFDEVTELITRFEVGEDVVTELTPRFEVEERPTGPTVGHEEMLKKAWNHIMDDGVGIMGLHGMGGVGKTTLFKKIHNNFTKMADKFDVVIWIMVSKDAEISKIREDIAQKLNIRDDVWKRKSEGDKAAKMFGVLKGKKFVLMLDDIWEKVDLVAIGVPSPTIENGSKVAFTTRSLKVCGEMGDHEAMQVNCLEWKEAWELFNNKIGVNTLQRNPIIEDHAKKVAEKCQGLPLALSVIGETMASKTTVQEWEHAVDILNTLAAKFPAMEDKILPILKFSYDNLVDEDTKSCFLYCSLFAEDHEIIKERLIDYWICEGFLGECQDIKRAKNKGYEVLGSLIRANLLTESFKTSCVQMHDVIREMALWIASDFGNKKEHFVVKPKLKLCTIPKVNHWNVVRRMSLMDNEIEEIKCSHECPELTTLFLQGNKLKNLAGEFIMSMKKLVVLDLSNNRSFNKLPKQISKLACLQYLNLSYTSIEELPQLKKLKKLIHLDLTRTKRLRSISGISKMSTLRILKLLNSICHGDASSVKELQLLKNLQVLNITISTKSGFELITSDQRLANCIHSLNIVDFREEPVNISLLVKMENLSGLHVQGCDNITYMKYGESKADMPHSQSPTRIPCITNLSHVYIEDCSSTKDLTWLLFAPNLVSLEIRSSHGVEEIINKEKATNFTSITPFQKLDYLFLYMLPKLESIYWSPLPFPFLKTMSAVGCPKLRKLPFDATSVLRIEELRMYRMGHPDQFEWDDEVTKNRFAPRFIRRDA